MELQIADLQSATQDAEAAAEKIERQRRALEADLQVCFSCFILRNRTFSLFYYALRVVRKLGNYFLSFVKQQNRLINFSFYFYIC
jgi:hypothetical protein